MLDVGIISRTPTIICVRYAGDVSEEEVREDRRFLQLVRGLQGAPFSVVCDFLETTTMSPEVADVFEWAQAFALDHGMVRDAFVCSSAVLRFQFSRIARDSRRQDRLGPLVFFDALEPALDYLRGS